MLEDTKFLSSAQVAQQATPKGPSLLQAIDAIQMQHGMTIGSAIVASLAELFPYPGIDLGEVGFRRVAWRSVLRTQCVGFRLKGSRPP
jgi:hypothetical protein